MQTDPTKQIKLFWANYFTMYRQPCKHFEKGSISSLQEENKLIHNNCDTHKIDPTKNTQSAPEMACLGICWP